MINEPYKGRSLVEIYSDPKDVPLWNNLKQIPASVNTSTKKESLLCLFGPFVERLLFFCFSLWNVTLHRMILNYRMKVTK